MSYRAISILVSLLITLGIWGNYTLGVINLYQRQLFSVETMYGLLFSAVIYTIFLEIILQTTLAIFKHKEANDKSDERDKIISRRANSYAYKILSFGVFCVTFYILFPVLAQFTFSMPGLAKEYEIMHLIIAFSLLAEVICSSVKLISYRRGY
ncbi:hypothetical protein [Colwellia hornerae]|uniref:Uncharacterized protein n=1 Tax=Colwellia hornerae TaxID=89402 RepID=A0A5C6QQX2_9GAMM|nr:hypothetical protein [Colwellia hornerae]TWX55717.1 hypothetical protein ESZ28_05985 [Colwellia hornerae]TWX61927.1 hypothetical protein ESZ26_04760 [Colwellia hornerae]TWX71259.1 hypothetical protein ESZ27_02340 [Colwellia hornerae]